MASGHHIAVPLDPAVSPPPTRTSSAARLLTLGGAFVLAAILLFYSLRGIDWAQVVSTAAQANRVYLAVAIVISSGSLFVRAMRWRVLLNARKPVDANTAFSA